MGQPIRFQCSKCRLSRGPKLAGHGRFDRVVLTGKQRHRKRYTGLRILGGGLRVQYQCLDCGHVGWSSHSDLRWLIDRDARVVETKKAAAGREVSGAP